VPSEQLLNVFGNFLINAETAEVRTSPKMEGKRTCLRVRNEIKCPHANTRCRTRRPEAIAASRVYFWPSIKTSSDVDYLGSQGLWVCSAIGVLSFAVLAFTGKVILGLFILLLYYLSGVGVREGSRYAAGWAFATYFGDMIITGPHIVKILLSALLLSNFRAT